MNKCAIVLLTAAIAAAPAAAQPATATIIFSAADFASPQARANLHHRIRNAIESVCGSYSASEVREWSDVDSCWKSARAEATRKLAAAKAGDRVKLVAR